MGLLNRFQPKKKIGVYLRKSWLQWLLNRFQPKKKNWGIPSEIMVAVVAQPVSTILRCLPNYTFGNQGCSGCSTGFNGKKNWGIPSEIRVAVVAQPVSTKKKFGYTFENQGCSG